MQTPDNRINELILSSPDNLNNRAQRSLVVGASGFIGNAVWRRLPARLRLGTYFKNEQGGMVRLDVRDLATTLQIVREFRPAVIYMPAAMPSADACEVDPHECVNTTVAGTACVTIAARDVGALLVYFSTDYVFDGREGPYVENDKPRPINIYGFAKLAAEELVRRTVDEYLILRLSSVYGYELRGKNFVMGLVGRLRRGERVRVPGDQQGTPTYVEDLARATIALAEGGQRGTIHTAGPETMGRYQFACLVANVFGLDCDLISSVSTAELGQVAPRPLRAGLQTARVQEYLGQIFRAPEAGLRATRDVLQQVQ